MCITSLLCGPRADIRPFYGFLACVQTSPLPQASCGWGDVCTQAMGFYVNGFLSI